MKRCPDCGADKPLGDFSPAARRADGRALYCKSCMSLRSQVSYRKKQAAAGRSVRVREQLPDGHRRCPDCGQVKPLDQFPRTASSRDGRHTYCKPCHNFRSRETRDRLYGGGRSYHLKARYGITAAEFDTMVEAQGGLCLLCRERPPQHVDHDHVTGTVRGLLCSGCNQGLGNFRDSVAALRAAVVYLERTTWQRQRVMPGVYRLTSPRPGAAPSRSSSELQHLISSRRG